MPLESIFKRRLIAEIQEQYPGAIVLRLDSSYIQGIPDNFIIWRNRWAAFEAKKDRYSPHRPNQDYYVNLLNKMSYASFVYPQNKETFLDELQQAFRVNRSTRISVG